MSKETKPEAQPEQAPMVESVKVIYEAIKRLVKDNDLEFGTFVFYKENQLHSMHLDEHLVEFEGKDITELPYGSFLGFMIRKELGEIMTKLDKSINPVEENPDE